MTTIYQVDSFTDKAFKGNPAGVCILEAMPEDQWLQDIAAEMNVSETAFIVPRSNGFALRWFTPTVEVDLCGHATLATAHVLRETGMVDTKQSTEFETLSGILKASYDGEFIQLDFPATPAVECVAPELLLAGLKVEPLFCGKTKFDYLVEVADESIVRQCEPDMTKLREFGVRGAMVTAKSNSPEFDFVSRFFAPGAGIDEDPVTGSAHCALAPFWGGKLGKQDMIGYQASARGGIVRTIISGDRVLLRGSAVTVLKCELVCV